MSEPEPPGKGPPQTESCVFHCRGQNGVGLVGVRIWRSRYAVRRGGILYSMGARRSFDMMNGKRVFVGIASRKEGNISRTEN